MENKIKNKLIPDLQDNKELKNTINFEGTDDYNVNAVTADVARHTMADLKLEPSVGRRTNLAYTYNGTFDGSADKAIKYVPSDGGKFTGPVQIDNTHGNYLGGTSDDEIISFGQIKTALSQLNGFPFCGWEVTYDDTYENDKTTFTTIDNTNNEPYKLNVVVGRTVDLAYFKNYADGKKNDKYVQDPTALTYSEVKEGNNVIMYEVTGLAANASTSTEIHIPGTRQDKPVRLGDRAFENNTTIQKVYISRGVTVIGEATFFGCTSLNHITIPDSVKSIGAVAFSGCTKLTEVDLSRELEVIPEDLFYGCKALKKITIGNKITEINSGAFSGCKALEAIYFTGTETDWNNIKDENDGDNPLKDKVYTNPDDKSETRSIAIHYGNMPFPFLYICKDGKDGGEDTSLTSNKMFLKLPNKDLIEISKGAVRLEKQDGQANYGYYTYDTLAAIIAGINTRLDALGGDTLKLPTALNIPASGQLTVIPNTVIDNSVLLNDATINAIPTVQQLEEAIGKIQGKNHTKIAAIIANNTDSLQAIREDLTDLAKEVEYDLGSAADGLGTAIDYSNSRIDKLEAVIEDIKDGDQTVGRTQGTLTINGQGFDGSTDMTIGTTDDDIKLGSDLYTYTPIGLATNANNEIIGSGSTISKTNPGLLGNTGDSLKSVFNKIFGTRTTVQPTISTAGTYLEVSAGQTSYGSSSDEFGTSYPNTPVTITFTLHNSGTAQYGYRCGEDSYYLHNGSGKTFYYPVTKQNGADLVITLPTGKSAVVVTTNMGTDASGTTIPNSITISGDDKLYCNFNKDKQVSIEITLPGEQTDLSEITRYGKITALVKLGKAQKENQITAGTEITKFLSYPDGDDATTTSYYSISDKSNSAGPYTLTAGKYYNYYITTSSTNLYSEFGEPVSGAERFNSSTVNIPCDTAKHIWFLLPPGTTGSKSIQYEPFANTWVDAFGGATDTTVGPTPVELTLDSGETVTYQGYYTSAKAAAGSSLNYRII